MCYWKKQFSPLYLDAKSFTNKTFSILRFHFHNVAYNYNSNYYNTVTQLSLGKKCELRNIC